MIFGTCIAVSKSEVTTFLGNGQWDPTKRKKNFNLIGCNLYMTKYSTKSSMTNLDKIVKFIMSRE